MSLRYQLIIPNYFFKRPPISYAYSKSKYLRQLITLLQPGIN